MTNSNINEFIDTYLNSTVRVAWNWWNVTEQGSRERHLEVTASGCHRFEVLDTKVRFYAEDVLVNLDTTSSWLSCSYDLPGRPIVWSPYSGGNVIDACFGPEPFECHEWFQYDNATEGKPTAMIWCHEGDRLETVRAVVDLIRPKNARWRGPHRIGDRW